MSSKFANGKHAIAICQRSGMKFLYKEMINEPGTGLFIHYSESDGAYNRVDHPQLHIKGVSDRIGLRRPHPDVNNTIPYLVDENGDLITVPVMFGVLMAIQTSDGTT